VPISQKYVQREPSCSMWTGRLTDRHDTANIRFSQFCDSPYKLHSIHFIFDGFTASCSCFNTEICSP